MLFRSVNVNLRTDCSMTVRTNDLTLCSCSFDLTESCMDAPRTHLYASILCNFFPSTFASCCFHWRYAIQPFMPDESKKLPIDYRSLENFHIFFVVLCLFVWSSLFQFHKTPPLFLLLFILLFNNKYNQNDQSLHANDGNFASVAWSQYAPIVFFVVEWYMTFNY